MSNREDILSGVDKKIQELQRLKDEILETQEVKIENLAEVKDRVDAKPIVPKFITGIKAIDDNMGGLSEGTFINIAGGNFAGKTTLVVSILKNLAEFNQVMFFSYEMYENTLVRNKFKGCSDNVSKNLLIEQKNNDLNYIDSTIRKLARNGVKLFAIDSRMKIKCDSNLQEFQKNSLISNTLAKLSQELGVIIVLIQQIALADLRNGRLDFKGSGDIAYDSDVSLFIVRDEKTEKRLLSCTKDRINERTWSADITDNSYQYRKEPIVTTFEPEINVEEISEFGF